MKADRRGVATGSLDLTAGDRILVTGEGAGRPMALPAFDGAAWAEVTRTHGDPAEQSGASADVIIVLEPFRPADPVRALSEIHRVLAPGGRLAILVPAAGEAGAGTSVGEAWRETLRRSALFTPLVSNGVAEPAAVEVLWAGRRGPATAGRDGIVAFVHTSPGGVPKRPVDHAWVHRLGVEGDGHVYTGHGGEDAAVCLLAQEAIERVRGDGHALFPGAVGENVTVLGIDWAALRVGDRLSFGSGLELELTDYATPCQTVAHWFTRRRIARIGHKLHPEDARWYARVLAEGVLEPGDTIGHEPTAGTSA